MLRAPLSTEEALLAGVSDVSRRVTPVPEGRAVYTFTAQRTDATSPKLLRHVLRIIPNIEQTIDELPFM